MSDFETALSSNGIYLGPDTGDRIFGAELKERRVSAGLSRTQLGRKIGVDGSMISKYECAHARPQLPSKETWGRLAEAFPGLYRPATFNVEERGKEDRGGNGGKGRKGRKGRKYPVLPSPPPSVFQSEDLPKQEMCDEELFGDDLNEDYQRGVCEGRIIEQTIAAVKETFREVRIVMGTDGRLYRFVDIKGSYLEPKS